MEYRKEMHFKYIKTHKVKIKVQEMIYYANNNHNIANVAILISEKLDDIKKYHR